MATIIKQKDGKEKVTRKRKKTQHQLAQSSRRRRVLTMKLAGKSNKEIAEDLGVHRNTVSSDLESMEKRIVGKIDDIDERTRKAILDLMFGSDFISVEAMRIYGEARPILDRNDEPMLDENGRPMFRRPAANTRLNALSLMHKVGADKIKLLQSLGVIKEAPQQITGTVAIGTVSREVMEAAFEEVKKEKQEEGRLKREIRRKELNAGNSSE